MQHTVCEESQGVGNIARNTPFDRLHPLPLALRRADLQASHVLGEEQGETSKVCVAALRISLCTIPFFLGSSVINHISQVIIGRLVIAMSLGEEVFGQFEDNGHKDKELACDFVKQITVEAGNLVVVLLHDVVAGDIVPGWDCLGDIQLLVVSRLLLALSD